MHIRVRPVHYFAQAGSYKNAMSREHASGHVFASGFLRWRGGNKKKERRDRVNFDVLTQVDLDVDS